MLIWSLPAALCSSWRESELANTPVCFKYPGEQCVDKSRRVTEKSDGLQESGGVLQIASLFDWKDVFEGTK